MAPHPLNLTIDELATLIQAAALKQAWVEASRDYWLRRAAQFEAAAPRPGDFVPPHITAAELAERSRLAHARATACRHRAEHVELWAVAGLAEALEMTMSTPEQLAELERLADEHDRRGRSARRPAA